MAPALVGLYILCWLGVVGFFRRHRIWLPYYLCGSIGLTFAIIFVSRWVLPVETQLEHVVALLTGQAANLLGLNTRIFDAAPGLLMVLVVTQPVGWTTLQITFECSGLLEASVLVGMMAFYPTWTLRRKAGLIAAGVMLTMVANIVRLLFIIGTLHHVGKDALFIAHTVVGRFVFFVAVIAIYWYVLTLPTLGTVRRKLEREMWA